MRFHLGIIFILISISSSIHWGCKKRTSPFSIDHLISETSVIAGVMPSSSKVNRNGAMVISIPVEVPPGTHHLAPQISFDYNSQAESNFMGKGFSLAGFSKIERDGCNINQDGFKGGVNYDENDRFLLDGVRLININSVSGWYGGKGALYRTEVESWSKIKVNSADCGSGPCSFKVTLKDGTKMEYGNTDDAKVFALGERFSSGNLNGSIREWLINKVTDLNGNSIEYSYTSTPTDPSGSIIPGTSNGGLSYPDYIRYTIHDSLSASRVVKFFYEGRQDTAPQFQAGAKVTTFAQLVQVSTMIVPVPGDTQIVAHYTLEYDDDAPLSQSRITRITHVSPNNQAIPSTEFKWSDGPNGLNLKTTLWTGPQTNTGWVGDFNGDGKTDIVPSQNNSVTEIWYADEEGFKEKSLNKSISLASYSWIDDFNGDGISDIFSTGISNGNIYFANDSGFNANPTPVSEVKIPSGCSTCGWTGDFNGDGLTDFLTQQSAVVFINFSDGRTLGEPTKIENVLITDANTYSADFNGDGLTDLLNIQNNLGTLYYSDLAASDTFLTSVSLNNLEVDDDCVNCTWVADFNGDLLPDIFAWDNSVYHLYLNNGFGFEKGIEVKDIDLDQNRGNWLGDYNGDGKMDFYAAGSTSGTVYYATGTSFEKGMKLIASLNKQNMWSGDFNGDGVSDLFSSISSSPMLIFGGDTLFPNRKSNLTPNLLTSIDNGIGSVKSVNYKPLTDTSIYQSDSSIHTSSSSGLEGLHLFSNSGSIPVDAILTNGYPIRQIRNAMYVVSDYRISDGRENIYPYSYFYRESELDFWGHGWLGFESVSERDSSVGKIKTTNYHQYFPLSHKKDSITILTLDSLLMKIKKFHYLNEGIGYNNGEDTVFQVLIESQNSSHYEYGTFAYTLGKQFQYDAYGNPTVTGILSEIEDPNDDVYKLQTFFNDTVNWRMGYPTQVKYSADSAGTDTLELQILEYDDKTLDLLKQSFYNSSTGKFEPKSWLYDDFGNQTHAIDQSGDTNKFEFDSLYHSFLRKWEKPPNQWGHTLSWDFNYSPKYGKKLFMVDPNQDTIRYVLDQFGRDSLMIGPDTAGKACIISAFQFTSLSDSGYVGRWVQYIDWGGKKKDTTWYFKDGLSRVYLSQTKGARNQIANLRREYNSNNQLLALSEPYFTEDTVYWTLYDYDSYSRLLETRTLGNYSTDTIKSQINYAPNSYTTLRASGTSEQVQTTRSFNFFNGEKRITSLVNENGEKSYFGYDLLGREISHIDPEGNTDSVYFNTLNQRIKTANSSFGTTRFIYQDSLRHYIKINSTGDSIHYFFDRLNRVLSLVIRPGDTIFYEYDLPDYPNSQGKLSRKIFEDKNRFYEYGYDNWKNQSMISLTWDDAVYTEKRVFSPQHKLRKIIYPDSSELIYVFGSNGLMDSVYCIDAGINFGTPFSILSYEDYNAANKPLAITYGNGLTLTQNYWPDNLENNYLIKNRGGDSLEFNQYNWDKLRRLKTFDDKINAAYSQQFTYQSAGRLKQATGYYGTINYDYDAAGNLTQKDSLTFNYQGFRPISGTVGSRSYYSAEFDAAGNMQTRRIGMNKSTYTYDPLNRLRTVNSGSTPVYTFSYDDHERRIFKEDHINSETTLYLSEYSLIVQKDRSPPKLSKNINVHEGIVATIETTGKNKRIQSYLSQDRLGSVHQATDENGNITSLLRYTPYGTIFQSIEKDKVRYKYGGKELDTESGLYYFSARYYDPFTGRFTTADTKLGAEIFSTDAFNRYAYTLNSPVNFSDKTGHTIDLIIQGVIILTDLEMTIATDGGAAAIEMELNATLEAEIKEAIAAEKNFKKFNKAKTVAAGKNEKEITESGWSAEKAQRYKDPSHKQVLKRGDEIGHERARHGNDNATTSGGEGWYYASHAEKQLSIYTRRPMAVSREMCPNCQKYFSRLAEQSTPHGGRRIVASPDYINIFGESGTQYRLRRVNSADLNKRNVLKGKSTWEKAGVQKRRRQPDRAAKNHKLRRKRW